MCWRVEYIILIIISTAVDYYCGQRMGAIKTKAQRKPYLYLSIFVNIGMLFMFKYFNFFSRSISTVFENFNILNNTLVFKLLLPIGISFYTFQTLSYVIDVYRGKMKPIKHLGIFALYVSFFPQLVAGPIERANRLIPQFFKNIEFNYYNIRSGLLLMLWGFFKKLVIADSLAIFVNIVYSNPSGHSGVALLLASYFFAFQIYCDFSGYSDIAIGAARTFGFDLMKNFNSPYIAISIRDFWKRWHISLSTWFKDYLYIPLGGSRVIKWRWYYNLLITFLISGLWHGANWTFVFWGLLHGFYLVISLWTKQYRNWFMHWTRIAKHPVIIYIVKITFTFHLVVIGWIIFRAKNIYDAIYIFKKIVGDFIYIVTVPPSPIVGEFI